MFVSQCISDGVVWRFDPKQLPGWSRLVVSHVVGMRLVAVRLACMACMPHGCSMAVRSQVEWLILTVLSAVIQAFIV